MHKIHNFATEAAFTTAYNNDYTEPWVSLTKHANRVDYNKSWYEKYSTMPLTFEVVIQSETVNLYNTLKWFTNNDAVITTIEYSYNHGEWKSITSTIGNIREKEVGGTYFDLPTNAKNGDIIQFRGTNATYGDYRTITSSNDYYNKFSIGVGNKDPHGNTVSPDQIAAFMTNWRNHYNGLGFKVYGNIMSLIDATNFANLTEFASGNNGNLKNLFTRMPIIDVSDLFMPATTLPTACYANMFKNTFIDASPILYATTLSNLSYQGLFDGCGLLASVRCMALNIGTDYTTNWMRDAGTGTFYKNPQLNTASISRDANGVPDGWVIQDLNL